MQWLLLIAGALAALHVANAFAPRSDRWPMPRFIASWLTNELVFHWLAIILLLIVLGLVDGYGDDPIGIIGLALLIASAIGLGILGLEAWRTRDQMRHALDDLGPSSGPGITSRSTRFPISHIVLPFLARYRRGIRRVRAVKFARIAGQTLRLDLTLPSEARPGDRLPVLVQIHGGAWVLGYKRQQGQPLLNHMATQGWIGVNIDYRLSPAATFPDHLIDCKCALAWVREHIADYGGDPDCVHVTGESAGAHLAALLACTANQARFQPGFEEKDTSVQGAVLLYGAYDMTNRLGTWPPKAFRGLLEPLVVKAFLDQEPERFALASPIDQVNADAPPVLVLHGDRDIVTPVDDTRLFVEELRSVSHEPVLYAELKGAQHAFELFPSLRAGAAIEGVERFLTTVWRRQRGELASSAPQAQVEAQAGELHEPELEPDVEATDLSA